MAWNQSTGAAAKPQPKKPSALRGVIAGVVCACLAAAVAFFVLSGKDEKPKAKVEKAAGRIKEVKPAVAVPAQNEPAKTNVVKKHWRERYKERFGDRPLNPARLARVSSFDEGLDKRPIVESNKVGEVRFSRYKNPVHAELVKYVYPGQFNGVPDGSITDEMARKFCNEPIEYGFDEPINVLEEKKAVEDMVKELKAHMDAGGSAQEFLNIAYERQERESETMNTVRKQVLEYCRSGDSDLATEALEKYNGYLRSKGLPPMKMNAAMKHYLKKNNNGRTKK